MDTHAAQVIASTHSQETGTEEHILLLRFFHDLNNHLGVVMGNAELLLDGTEEEKRGKRTRAIHTAASKAAALVLEMQIKLG